MSTEPKVPEVVEGSKLDKSRDRPAPPARRRGASRDVPHVDAAAVRRIAQAARELGRGHKGERDRLLIFVLFDACLRVSESLGLRPSDIYASGDGYRLRVVGKGDNPGEAAVSPETAAALYAYLQDRELQAGDAIFPITRKRAHQIVQRAFHQAGVAKPDGTGHCHVLRHSGALARLRVSQHPKSIQNQLRHLSIDMTMRYWKTLQREEALKIQEGVDPWV